MRPWPDVVERLLGNLEENGEGCLIWGNQTAGDGYRQISYEGSRVYAHRLAYEMFIGPIPDGMELDHLCRNRGCVNPAHLEPVSHRENTLRGSTFAAEHPKADMLPSRPKNRRNREWRARHKENAA